jgi:hypothetical protein
VEFPAHLLDELARVFAQVALDRLLKDAMAAASKAGDESGEPRGSTDAVSTAASPPCDGAGSVTTISLKQTETRK